MTLTTAISLHLGNPSLLEEMLSVIQHLERQGLVFDLYITLQDGKAVKQTIHTLFPKAVILEVENRGMDVGGFLYTIPVVCKYDYVLKLHSKTDEKWRRGLYTPLVNDVRMVFSAFERDPTVGAIGPRRYIYSERKSRPPNAYYLEQLAKYHGVPYQDTPFVGGTMFWIRGSLLKKIRDVKSVLKTLNTPETFDPNWYSLYYRVPLVQAQEHYNKEVLAGKAPYKNCLDGRIRKGNRIIGDGMKEHAYERFFGLLVTGSGYKLLGL